MGTPLTHHNTHSGMIARLMQRFDKGLSETLQNRKAQHESWRRFHQTVNGRLISRRAWMRHGAMLELISKRGERKAW